MPAKKAAAKSVKKPTFAEARARLDEILEALEREADDVDQLAARIKEASELIRLCRERLSAARHEVRDVVAELAAEPQAAGASAPASASDPGSDPAPASDPDEAGEVDEESGSGEGTLPF